MNKFESGGSHRPNLQVVTEERITIESTTAYAESLAPILVAGYADLGLDDTFSPIFGRHIADLHLTHSTNQDDGAESKSRLMVRPDSSTNECNFARIANLDDQQLKIYAERLKRLVNIDGKLIKKTEPGVYEPDAHYQAGISDSDLLACAAEWIFYELSADAASNSCHMQVICDTYIPDYNGQCKLDQAELTISRNFYNVYGQDGVESEQAIMQDAQNLRTGIALHFLRGALLRYGLVDSVVKASWYIKDLREDYPVQASNWAVRPFEFEEIQQHLIAMRPNETRQQMKDYIDTLDPLEDFLSED